MAISTELEFEHVDNLYLDPQNPRLGRSNTSIQLTQEGILDLMKDWTLDELAVSYLESGGFWTHEALLVIEENFYGDIHLVVVEGNRRLAALKYLKSAYEGNPTSSKWEEIAASGTPNERLFTHVPYLRADSREDVEAFLGFRHVTGIKEWPPAEKARFIAKLVDARGLSYVEVMRKIGSKTPTVRQHYIAHRLLEQIENTVEDFDLRFVERRFSVMYLSLRTRGVQQYLQIDIYAEPEVARTPVPEDHLQNLANFARWLFGTEEQPPIFTDSRQVDNFGLILQSEEATKYLERAPRPKFEVALDIAGGDEQELVGHVQNAADSLELALSRIHLYKRSPAIRDAVRRLGADAYQLLVIFPEIRQEIEENI